MQRILLGAKVSLRPPQFSLGVQILRPGLLALDLRYQKRFFLLDIMKIFPMDLHRSPAMAWKLGVK
jgi:hypothetical protein